MVGAMNDRERAVELLRCAADLVLTDRGAFVAAELDLEVTDDVGNLAHAAWIRVTFETLGVVYDASPEDVLRTRIHGEMLEAAQRLDEGSDDVDAD